MKYQVGDLVKWNDDFCDPKENIMLITEVKLLASARSDGEQYYYRYTYLETGRQDSFMGTSYETDTLLIA